jgi:hypothetical protein
MPGIRALSVAVLATVVVGCGGASASTTPQQTVRAIHAGAVRLLFANANATALPRAYNRAVLRRRMRRFVATGSLERHLDETASAIAKVGGRRYWQSWTEAITVGRWERHRLTGHFATVAFLGYETICPTIPPKQLPMERFTVRMAHEHRRWMFVSYTKRWLTDAGPLGVSGALTIRALPQRIVFRNPRPRAWRYRGPHFQGLARCD